MNWIFLAGRLLLYRLLLHVCVGSITIAIADKDNDAFLVLEIQYDNPKNQLENGYTCDFMPHQKRCDVHFQICITSEPYTGKFCDVRYHVTETFEDQQTLNLTGAEAIRIPLTAPYPIIASLSMELIDDDGILADSKIGTFVAHRVQLLRKIYPATLHLQRQLNGPNGNPALRVSAVYNIECYPQYGGVRCNVYCDPDSKRYTCNEIGAHVCLPGYYGDNCSLANSCHWEPCASNAICIHNELEFSRTCLCNGGEGPECYLNHNPCARNPCWNGGTCERTGEYNASFICECIDRWTGPLCDQKISACADYSQKLQNSNTTGADVCKNDGICIDHAVDFTYHCICAAGWTGNNCQTPLLQNALTNVFLIATVALGCLVFFIVLCVFCLRRQLRRRRLRPAPNLRFPEKTVGNDDGLQSQKCFFDNCADSQLYLGGSARYTTYPDLPGGESVYDEANEVPQIGYANNDVYCEDRAVLSTF